MSNELLTLVWPLAMSPTEKAVLIALADSARDPSATDRPGQTWLPITGNDGATGIVERTCLSERAVQRAIAGLVRLGHITRKQVRHGVIYTVHPGQPGVDKPLTPVTATGDTLTPVAVTPDTQSLTPVTVAPKASITIISQKTSSSSKAREPKARAVAVSIPDWIPIDPWNGWLAMRKAKRASPTARAIELAILDLKKLADDGHPPGAVLDQSTKNNWTSLYPIKESQHGQRFPSSGHADGQYRPGAVTGAILAARDAVDPSSW